MDPQGRPPPTLETTAVNTSYVERSFCHKYTNTSLFYIWIYYVYISAVGGLTSSAKGPYTEPLYITGKPPSSLQLNHSSIDCDEEEEQPKNLIVAEKETKGGHQEETGTEASKRSSKNCPQSPIYEPNHKRNNRTTTVSELELRKLERGELSVFWF